VSAVANACWAGWIIEELVRNGIRHIGIAPGSRSAPLTVAAARHPGLRTTVHFDERALGFHALGWARGDGRAAAVITTSGTAVANLLPAVAEAAQDRVPMLLLTADRPPELRATDANQTLVQPGMFGSYTRWAVDMPCPDPAIDAAYVLTTIDQAWYRAHRRPAGPVHVNIGFREPLIAAATADPPAFPDPPARWRKSTMPYTQYQAVSDAIPEAALAQLEERLRGAGRGVIRMGYVADDAAGAAVERLAEVLGWPILPDVASGLRLGASSAHVMPFADWLGGRTDILGAIDVILHVGGRMVNPSPAGEPGPPREREYLQVVSHPDRHDPFHQVTLRVEGEEGPCCRALADRLAGTVAPDPAWPAQWRAENDQVGDALAAALDGAEELSEPWIARRVAADLPRGHVLVLGNSRPIRDVQFYGHRAPGDRIPVAANRGVSGIDGMVATAAGFVAARGTPATLLLGDLSLLHDLTSLRLLGAAHLPLTVVVVNNDGGGIFELLPVAEAAPDVFEAFFATPHGLSFAAAAEMFGIAYRQPADPAAFRQAYREATEGGAPALIEVRIARQATRDIHHRLEAEVRSRT
jgi:2-succinyl-5-enolpyruvyl-6-hydroxy-3-cyclohexene-1-carboxylate synthase